MKKLITWIVIIAVLVGIGYTFKVRIAQKNAEKAKKAAAHKIITKKVVKLETVKKGTLYDELKIVTAAKGIREVSVFSDAPGKFVRYLVNEGDFVKKDDVICEVERDVRGLKYKPVTVTAPITGYAANLFIDRGQMVTPQMPVAVISNYDRIELSLNIPGVLASQVYRGQECYVEFDGNSKRYNTRLSNVSPIIDRRTNTFIAKAYLGNKDKKIRSGQMAKVFIIKKAYRDYPIINRDAVIDGNYVFLYKNGVVHKRAINIIYGTGNFYAVKGVMPGDKYVIFGQNMIKDGEKVETLE